MTIAARWIWVVAAGALLACGGGQGAGPSEGSPQPADAVEEGSEDTAEGPSVGAGAELAESGAQDVARDAAREAGYDPDEYRITSTSRDGDVYTVVFELPPPTPPGGHFGVLVNARSGEAEVMPGE